jgi:non-specific serine/threonine protein kinase
MMLFCLGGVASEREDYPRAAPLFKEALGIWQARGDRWGVANAKLGLAEAATAMGEAHRAGELLAQALAHYADLGDTSRLAACLEVAARVMVLRRRPIQAIRLLGAAEQMRIAAGVALGPLELPRHTRTIDYLRPAIDHDAYEAAWSAGRSLSVEGAVAEALEGLATAVGGDRGGEDRGLTRREREVLRLLAEGLSDVEIAEALYLAPRTVSWHVSHILTKLDVASRTAAATAAIRGGLIRDPQ